MIIGPPGRGKLEAPRIVTDLADIAESELESDTRSTVARFTGNEYVRADAETSGTRPNVAINELLATLIHGHSADWRSSSASISILSLRRMARSVSEPMRRRRKSSIQKPRKC